MRKIKKGFYKRRKFIISTLALIVVFLFSFSFDYYILGIVSFLILVVIQIQESKKKYQECRNQYDRTLALLEKMNCMILEYDIATDKIKTNSLFDKAFGYSIEEYKCQQ